MGAPILRFRLNSSKQRPTANTTFKLRMTVTTLPGQIEGALVEAMLEQSAKALRQSLVHSFLARSTVCLKFLDVAIMQVRRQFTRRNVD